MERQTNQFNHYLTQLLKTDNRDELERIAFDAASFLGFEYLAYLPFAPMQQDKQRIINIPKTFTEAYKKHNWLSNDMLLERAAYERGHFYMSESMAAIQKSPFYGGHKIHQCQNMVAAFKAMVCPDALYIPLGLDNDVYRLVILAFSNKPSRAAESQAILLAHTLHHACQNRFSDDFNLDQYCFDLKIIRGLASGINQKELAESFGMSPSTIEKHIKRITDLMGTVSRQEMLVQAQKFGILDNHHMISPNIFHVETLNSPPSF